MDRTSRVVDPVIVVTIGEPTDALKACAPLQGTQQLAKSYFPFAAHDVVHIHFHIGFSGETGIVAAHNDFHARLESTRQIDDTASSSALERHYRQSDNVGVDLVN